MKVRSQRRRSLNRLYLLVLGIAALALGGMLVTGLLDWLIRLTGIIMIIGGVVAVIAFFVGGKKSSSSDW